MDIIPAKASKSSTKDTTFANYLVIVDVYTKIIQLHGMENITSDKVMAKIGMFQERFEKVDGFCWWDMKKIQSDAGMQFTSNGFLEGFSIPLV